jgi:replicative DNA helicase
MSLDESLISTVVRYPDTFSELLRAGISEDDFTDEYRTLWRYLHRTKHRHGKIPSRSTISTRFPDMEWARPKERDLPVLIEQLRQRRKWSDFLTIIDEAATAAGSPEDVDEALTRLSASASRLAASHGTHSHMVDLFDRATTQKMLREIRLRKFGGAMGMPTGLKRLDAQGGMIKGRSYVLGGRTGLGKSWIDLLFVASAVIAGYKFILYPLEMTLTETAFRLYTIFSQKMFGGAGVLKNTDLTHGYVTKRQAVRVLHALEDKFAGQLFVADIGSMSDPYTVDRIDAEVQVYKPDGYWIDYITLLKAPEMKKGGEDYSAIRYLSSGVKGINIRNDVVGGMSAQINREALKVRSFIPRLEHISYGDSIGHDADHVVMINRRGQYLYYAEVKDRHGPEIPTTRVRFFVDEGVIEETEEQGSEGDDD